MQSTCCVEVCKNVVARQWAFSRFLGQTTQPPSKKSKTVQSYRPMASKNHGRRIHRSKLLRKKWLDNLTTIFFSAARQYQSQYLQRHHRFSLMSATLKASIAPVPTANDFLDIVLSKTQRKTPTVIHPGYKITRIRAFYMRKVMFTKDAFTEKLQAILTEFPVLEVCYILIVLIARICTPSLRHWWSMYC